MKTDRKEKEKKEKGGYKESHKEKQYMSVVRQDKRSQSEGMNRELALKLRGVMGLVGGIERKSHGKDFSPFTLESFNIAESIKRDRRRVPKSRVGSKEVVISDKESGKRKGAVIRFEAVSSSCMEFVGAVKTFYKLLKRSVFLGFGIEVLETDNFFMDEGRRMRLVDEVNTSRIRGVSVGDQSNFLVRT